MTVYGNVRVSETYLNAECYGYFTVVNKVAMYGQNEAAQGTSIAYIMWYYKR